MYWPVGIGIFLTLFVLSLIGFVIFTLGVPVRLVSPNYYAESVAHQARIEEETRGNALPISHVYDREAEQFTIEGLNVSPEVTVLAAYLYRPSDPGIDTTLLLQFSSPGQGSIDVSDLDPGLWQLQLSWRAEEKDYYREFRFTRKAIKNGRQE